MAIYTRFGSEVTLCDARLIPVWIETGRGEIKWHYSQPKPRKRCKVEERPVWHYRGWNAANGSPICDNKWVPASSLKADDGWEEIQAKLDELCPDGTERFQQWNTKDAPEASALFIPISAAEAA